MTRKTVGVVFLVAMAATAWAAGGGIDTDFGSGGAVVETTPDLFEAIARQGDGVVVAGDDVVRRYALDGTVDTSFGSSGETILTGLEIHDLVVDASGRILVTGRMFVTESSGGNGKGKKGGGGGTTTTAVLAVARLDSDGDPDTSFGDGGLAGLNVADSGAESGRAVRVQSDGKIVVAGMARAKSSSGGGGNGKKGGKQVESDAILVGRFTSAGALDTTFGGGNGYLVDDVTTENDIVFFGCLAIQSGGGLVVASTPRSGVATLTRYSGSGTPDTDFGAVSGDLILPRSLVIDDSGRILVSGTLHPAGGESDAAVARYTATGSLDTSFGSGGVASSGRSGRDEGGALALDADGGIVLAVGDIPEASANFSDCLVLRLDADGSLNTSFGSGGFGATLDTGYDEGIFGIVLDGAGGIIGAGGTVTNSTYVNQALLARWLDE